MRETVDRLQESLYRVKVPLPFPLRWVNAYALRGSEGWTIIDPGLHTPEAEAVWKEAMTEIGFDFGAVEQIVLTHFHPDHYGLAGWFQERCRADVPVRLTAESESMARRMWGPGETLTLPIQADFLRHGMDEETAAQMVPHLDDFQAYVSPQPAITPLEADTVIRLGDREYRTILTPGHAAGHLCFYEETSGEIFCGDQVLPKITPNVSFMPGCDPNPLDTFLGSLESLADLPVSRAYPGHRDPFNGFGDRAREIIRHHVERLEEMMAGLDVPLTAYEVCRRMFGNRLSIHQLRFAMGEALAHLVYLVNDGRVVESKEQTTGVIHYRKRT